MTTAVAMNQEIKIPFLDRQWMGRSNRIHLREFGIVFGIFFIILCGWSVWKHGDFQAALIRIYIAAGFVFFGYACPIALWPLWKAWMAFGHVLGMVMNAVILSIVWTLLLLPFAILLRIIGKKVMDTTFRTAAPSYYEDRPAQTDFSLLKRQF